ncbi:phospholipase D-like domain-containing protein [Zavarzinella formosa]|uniref:phospholipase D-like domain-containing protein n=1 Tax=Zavarzinella formosa TaxID=360055 RepID=UPI0002F9799D|nr:phospholipase D-like domain-containing protein [Zavarzinella formosa]
MSVSQLDDLLRRTVADGQLQTAERKVLADWAVLHAEDDHERSLARSRCFALAREVMANGNPATVLNWLEEVNKIFARPPEAKTHATVQLSSRAFFSPGLTCVQEVLHEFQMAKQTADVCVFTITDDRITRAIIQTHQRGVKVRVLTDDEKSRDLGSDIGRLVDAGIPCKMDIGNPAHMHHKYAIFDNRLLLNGSFNWTRSASENNEENLIVTPDPALVKAFADRFELLWEKLREA